MREEGVFLFVVFVVFVIFVVLEDFAVKTGAPKTALSAVSGR